jgi:hypothetical protein
LALGDGCCIGTVLNALEKDVYKIICLSKFHSFRRIRKVAESAISFVMSLPSWNNSALPLNEFSSNFVLGIFIKICRESSRLLTIGHKHQALYMAI